MLLQLQATPVLYLAFTMALLYLLLLSTTPIVSLAQQQPDLASFVRTNTGSEGGGNTFPGVSEPFGMVKIGPDVINGRDSYSGYQASGDIRGFSMLHLSGTGGAPKYGVVAQMPVSGTVDNPLEFNGTPRTAPDETQVGYYKSQLKGGVTVELAASSRAAMYQYTFPASSNRPKNVIVDVSSVLPSFRKMGLGQNYLGGSISVERDDRGSMRYSGSGSYDNGWNRSPKWTVYFCGSFNSSATFKTFVGTNSTGSVLSRLSGDQKVESDNRLGAVFTFDSPYVTSRVGVSFISEDQACGNVDQQVPATMSLTQLRDRTRQVWNSQVLSKVTATDRNSTKLQQLYTSMYFMHLMPINKTGENPKWKSAEPYYDDLMTLWDLFRCTTSLLHVFQPTMYEEFIRSMIDIWRHDGYMPDARTSFFNGALQGGSNSDNVLADAYVKGVRGAINWDDGFAAMAKNAEVVPKKNDDGRDNSGSTKEGRGALPDWAQKGYITTKYTRSVSRAIEYAGNDFGLYQVAKGMGKDSEADKYLKRSRQWRNHWNRDMTALGFSGFLGPRGEDGLFKNQDPMDCGNCYWGDSYYEALPWEYSMNAHHDMSTLINYAGGPEPFLGRLNKTFEPNTRKKGNEQFGKMIFNPGNEPSFTTPYLFNYVGRQDLSVKTSRFIGKTYYSVSPDGLPGNSDSGAMESWLLWAMLGLYPMTGQTTFLIGSPWLDSVTIALGGGKQLKITSKGGSESSYYVQSLMVNGKPWTKSWLTWNDVFANGGSLDFVLGPKPSDFGARNATMPPSPASEAERGQLSPGESISNGSDANSRPAWVLPVAVVVPVIGAIGLAAGLVLFVMRRNRRRSMQMRPPSRDPMRPNMPYMRDMKITPMNIPRAYSPNKGSRESITHSVYGARRLY